MSERNTTDISRIWIFEAENQGEGVGEEPKMKRALEICLKFPWVYCWIKICASARGDSTKLGQLLLGKCEVNIERAHRGIWDIQVLTRQSGETSLNICDIQ